MNAQTPVEPASLSSAMAAAFSEIEGATKSANNPHFKTKYADLTAVIDAIKPALINHGLFFTQHPRPSENGVTIETVLHHSGGEQMSLGMLFVPANKQDAQGFGSALTYARRYALVTAFGVPVEDDDGNAAARGTKQESAVSPPQPITDADWALIVQLVESTGTNAQALCEAYKVGSLKELSPAQFKEARGILEKRLAAKAKEPVNA